MTKWLTHHRALKWCEKPQPAESLPDAVLELFYDVLMGLRVRAGVRKRHFRKMTPESRKLLVREIKREQARLARFLKMVDTR